MDDYTAKLIKYINNPKFKGKLENSTHVLNLKSSFCGDWNDIHLEIKDGIIEKISYENSGCSLNIASLEIICSFLLNKSIDYINNLEESIVSNELNFPKHKSHCVKLSFDTLKKVEN